MRIALITDVHYGIRGDSPAFLDANKRFFDEVFFPYLKDRDITNVVCLGDLLDRRKYINFLTAKRLRTDFIEPLLKQCKQFIWILGNHDIYFKHSLEVSAAYELGRDYPIAIVDHPCEFGFGELNVLMVPWISDENRKECYEAIINTDSTVLFGHLEIQGFEMFKGVTSNVGDDKKVFEKFSMVCSGHFHHRHSRDNIHYLGAMGDYSWADYNDSRGFHVLDTETQRLEFIANPFTMFAKLYYDDSGERSVIPPGGFDSLQGKIVKVIILKQTSADQFDWFMTQLEAAKPLQIQMVHENLGTVVAFNSSDISDKDTLTVIRDCIKMANNSVNPTKLERLFVNLYQEAQDVE